MEEKERYVIVYFDNDTSWKIIDNKTKQEVGGIDDMIKLLNQQDKRIKELEETNKVLSNELTKNSILKQDHIETCCGIPIFEIPKMKEENQQLKQQLHYLPKKIVEDIKKQLFNHFKVKNIEEYEKLPLIDSLFTADTVIEILDTILEKYGDKNEGNND